MNKLLRGKRILVTRPAAQAAQLTALIAGQGGEAICFPLLEIGPPDDSLPLQKAIERLDDYALAIFISPNAVDYSVPQILARHPWPTAWQVAAIGPGSVAQLASFGVGRVIAPLQRFDSEALLELPELQAENIAGKKVLILRGNGGRELLAETLMTRGAEVAAVTCYRRSAPADGAALLSLLRNNGLDAVTLSSSEGLHTLLALLDTDACERLCCLPVFVPHWRIYESAGQLGLQKRILTAPTDAGILAGLCEYPWH